MICATDTTRTATEAGDAFNGATDPAACSVAFSVSLIPLPWTPWTG
uniref:Uncharacterized protein n=1 Tax=Picea glauca TaxID=3330 RepID=A0A101LZN0_PICGL|nr:hypothetical protein ABT39_MTgene5296 [Picea glauca]QHR88872.1 hypothetical protein Q903MT_gene2891 [Picea sitchensis]